MDVLSCLVDGLLDLLSPESCVVCDRRRDVSPWASGVSGHAPGLHRWHASHLCSECFGGWHSSVVPGGVASYPLWSALPEDATLIEAVGQWKYRGLRGLARPLAALLVPVLEAVPRATGITPGLAPVPLHRRRRRERGFDQCLQMAVLAGRAAGLPVVVDAVVRRRATDQQASCPTDCDQRARNVSGAFVARPCHDDESGHLILLDDLATTGATLAAAADAAVAAGWQVTALVALGQSRRLRARQG